MRGVVQVAAGTKIGPYEIVSFIGAGGMGEVYRARDPRLSREVAIKFLPSQSIADPERLRRFEQEARAAGQLSHPNILTIFDIVKENDAVFVVSELLVGETLRERMGGVALPVRKAVEFALQISHGLAAAHEKGIVHRDLKPENIFLTKDGRVKILDFGLAKLTNPEPVPGEKSALPTADPGTRPGIVLGTVGYMSPEQVRARETDHRSDIFSFGTILYEMLTGKRAFHRDSTADTLSAILKEDPPEVSGIASNVPPSLERVLRHCLEKNPEQRFQSARDLAFDLEMISGISGSSTTAKAVEAPRPHPAWRKGVAILLTLAAIAGAFWLGRQTSTKLSTQTAEGSSLSFKRLTFRRGFISNGRFTPDGQSVIYSASWLGQPEELFVTRPQNPVSRALGITDAALLSVSRTGEMAVLLGPRFTLGWQRLGTLARAPLDGGAPREILKDVQDADFSSDGMNFAVSRVVNGRYRLEFPIGKALYETDGWLNYLKIAPDGKHVAFMDHQSPGDDRGIVAVVDLAGNVTRLTNEFASESGLHWTTDGKEIWFSGSLEGSNEQPVYAVTLQGKQRLVVAMAGNLVLQDIDAKGNVLINRDSRRREIIALPPGAEREQDLSWFDWSFPRYLSNDGNTMVFEEQGAGGGPNYTVYMRKMDGSPAVKLGEGFCGPMSPDGKYVATQMPGKENQIHLLPTGAGDAKVINNTEINFNFGSAQWFQDSNRLLVAARQPGKLARLWICDVASGKVVPATPEGVAGPPLISPDQSSVLARSDHGFFFYPLGGSTPKPALGLEQGDTPLRWNTDNDALFVSNGRQIPVRVFRVDLNTGQRTLWKELTPPDVAGIVSVINVLITPDGKWYAYTFRRALSDLYIASGLSTTAASN